MKTDRNSMCGFKTTSVIIRAKNNLKKEYFCPHFLPCVRLRGADIERNKDFGNVENVVADRENV